MDITKRGTSEYQHMSQVDIMKKLETSSGGLTTEEANSRIKKWGLNIIEEKKKHPLLGFFKRYWGPMPWLLECAIVLTVILKHYTESVIIFTLLTANAVIGYLQSRNSQKAVELLKRRLARQVGIGDHINLVNDLKGLTSQEQVKLIERSDGFAEVYPEDKYYIVTLLQASGHTVGMTGDGVNDAPALKQAELGTAVSEATDVAKASASIVLTQPGLREIVDAVKISRKTYQRMLTWVLSKITKVVEVIILFTVGFFWLHDVVISLLGMSLLVFANDFATMSIATDNVKSTSSPNKWEIKNITLASLVLGMFFALGDLLIMYIGQNYFKLEFDRLQTLVMLCLVFNSQFRILLVRERRHFWSSTPNKSLILVNILVIVGFSLLGIIGIFMPNLPLNQVLMILGITMAYMICIDFIKYPVFRLFRV